MEATERLSLPMLVPGQAQKEVFHNEALLLLDAMVAGAVDEALRNDPPVSSVVGTCYLVGGNPSGVWAEHPDHIAAFTAAGWRFIAPVAGMTVLVKPTGSLATFLPAGWDVGTIRGSRIEIDGVKVVGPQTAAIPAPSGGTTVDLEARNCLAEVLAALQAHGLIAV